MSTEKYRDKIDQVITEASGEVVLNGSHDHAAVILERMFSRARTSVRILTRKFDPRIYCDEMTVNSARKMLGDTSRSIQVLIEEPEATSHKGNPYFEDLSNIGNLEIRVIPEHLKGPISINFALMDDAGFRLEKDQAGTTAIVCFGNKEITPRLKSLFDRVWSQSEKVVGSDQGEILATA